MNFLSTVKNNFPILILLLVSALLIFTNLGNIYLWQDEACVALIGKNVLNTGLPLVFDGTHWVTSVPLEHQKSIYVDSQTWLEYYFVAFSFLIFGINTFSARFPFALSAFLGVAVAYFFFKKVSSKNIALISSLLLAFSIPYILYARQCSFYATIPLLYLGMIYFYLRLLEAKRHALSGLVVFSALLHYMFFVMFFIVLFALLLHFFAFGFYKGRLRPLMKALLIVFILIAPSFLFLNIFYRFQQGQTLGMEEFFIKIKSNLLWINNYIFPLLLLLVYLLLKVIFGNKISTKELIPSQKSPGMPPSGANQGIGFRYSGIHAYEEISASGREPRPLGWGAPLFGNHIHALLLFVVALNFFAIAVASDAPYFRYLYATIPILTFFLAKAIFSIAHRNKLLLVSFLAVIIFSNFLSILPMHLVRFFVKEKQVKLSSFSEGIYNDLKRDPFKSDLLSYLYEITHDYDCPVKEIVSYLNKNAKSTDLVKTSYNDLPLQFYTKLRIINWKDKGGFAPDWIIPVVSVPLSVNQGFLASIKDVKYERIELGLSDICYSNLPEPLYHNFSTVRSRAKPIYYNFQDYQVLPKVTLFKKISF